MPKVKPPKVTVNGVEWEREPEREPLARPVEIAPGVVMFARPGDPRLHLAPFEAPAPGIPRLD
jgi:hypothetical protein